MASATPVLPLVGSMIVVTPRVMRPCRSASWIMLNPMRSLTLPPGLNDSSLPTMVAPVCSERWLRATSGVPPMSSVTLPAIFIALLSPAPPDELDLVGAMLFARRRAPGSRPAGRDLR